MNCKLAIFDLDGTILNTIEDLSDSANFICHKNGYPLHTVDEYKYMVGNGIPKLVQRFLPADVDEETRKKIFNEYVEYYANHSAIKTRPYDGIPELLKALKERGVKLAVNTNKVESASVELCNDYFPGIFDYISGNKEGIPVKPAPDGVYRILDKAGISKQEAGNNAVYIGDSDVDFQTGTNAGLEVINVDWGFRGKDFLMAHGAKRIAMKPKEILEIIEKI